MDEFHNRIKTHTNSSREPQNQEELQQKKKVHTHESKNSSHIYRLKTAYLGSKSNIAKRMKTQERKCQKIYTAENLEENSQFKWKSQNGSCTEANTSKKGIKFPKSRRNLTQASTTSVAIPGPDVYKHQTYNSLRNDPKFSFGKEQKFLRNRKQTQMKAQIPGPQSYSPKRIETKLPQKFPISSRQMSLEGKLNPGVGSYDIEKEYFKRTSTAKIPTSERKCFSNRSFVPGPAQYQPQFCKSKTGNQFFTKEARLRNSMTEIPGVGQYSVEKYQPKNRRSARMSTSQRDAADRYFLEKAQGPGPDQYTPCDVTKYKSSSKDPSIKFPRKKRDSPASKEKMSIPGPGSYNLALQRSKIIGGILSSRLVAARSDCQGYPGPQNYEINREQPQSVRIGKEQRFKGADYQSPSPNHYRPENAKINFKHNGFAFSKAK